MAGLNSWVLNSVALNAAGEEDVVIIATGSGVLVEIEQLVAIIGSGSLVGVEQDVQLQIVGSGALIDVEQNVMTKASGALINISQKVLSADESTFFTRNGWDVVVSLGGFNVPRDSIQEVSVIHSIGDDSRAQVFLNPGSGAYSLYSYQGKELIISARTGASYKRIFTGIVDIPRVEVVNEKIVLEGVASRETLIRNALTPYVAGIGSYSETVFGPLNNVFQETNDRMQTIPSDLDFDPYNNWTVTSWTPKGTPDTTLTDSDLYRERQPEVRIESAREVVNKVGIDFKYAYERLHQVGLSYSWNASISTCTFLTKGNTLPTRDMIRSAAAGTGWKVGTMSFTNLWDSGFYYCSGNAIGWVNTRQDVILRNTGATDPSGNDYTQSRTVGTSDINALLALGASWTAKKRFTQSVEETYTLTVNSPQSQTLYGVRERNENIALQAEFDVSQWEDEALYDKDFAGTKVSANSTTYYINKDVENAELGNAITTALNKAKTDILRSHRDTEITYTTFIDPDVQLRHTVYVNTTRVDAKGKVRSISHSFKATGEAVTTVKLALYRSVGSQSESTLSAPARPTFETPSVMSAAALGSRWGQDPSTTSAKSWTGYVGNKWVTSGGGFNTNTYKTAYQESFVVDSPAIPDLKRELQKYRQSGTYNISIPTDTLTITFVDS